jgi:indoleamine 2,3-dioxygenase
MYTFTGCYDESWFYTVPLSIELAGATAVNAILDAQRAILRNDSAVVEKSLTEIADVIEKMIGLLRRMYERCDPAVFWRRIRPYSGGSKNSESFPNGVFYEGIEEV